MRIEVRLCNSLACRTGHDRAFALTFKAGTTVGDVLARLNLSHGALRLALCNGRALPLDGKDGLDGSHVLVDGDHLVLGAAEGESAARPSPSVLPGLLQRLGSLLSPSMQIR